MTTALAQEFAFWLVVLFALVLALGVGQFGAWLVWRQRPRPARLPAPEDDDPDVVSSLEMFLAVVHSRQDEQPIVEAESP